ncbi:hypothetical protein ACO9S2_13325 [Nitrospira sp. NS4]|uniref:hypothetical protein n=1 Tax=Nitrospira sp. NS4 TaxID=3414498 RepID=UPI003C2C615C
MTWLEQWRDLAGRIDGLIRSGEFLVSAFRVNSADAFSVVRKSLLPELKAIIAEIDHLGKTYASELPQQALVALQQYVAQGWGKSFNDGAVDIQTLAPLASFRSQFDYLIRDTESDGRSLTELAFEHLRRQLVVDEDIRKKWQLAFKRHETACERLGAVHLLSHGIWAFKIVAPGGATDLVFGDPVKQHAEVMTRTARALVLTEWKLIKRPDEIATKAQEARDQAAIYSGGMLGDAELKRTRYIVLVSEADLVPPEDVSVGTVTHRHILLPTSPKSPSRTARSQRSRKKSKDTG